MLKNTIKNLSVKSRIILAVIAVAVCISTILTATGKWHDVYGFFGLNNGISFALSEGTSVHFIDVGQGDCILIMTQESSVLIDSGERAYAAVVINYLRAQNVGKLDLVIATHPHSDHMGSMSAVIDEFGADRIIMPRLPEELVPTTTAFLRLLDSIENNDVEVIWAEAGMIFELGGNSRLEILAPLKQYEGMNDNSVVAKLTLTSGSFLLTGDIEDVAESDLADSRYNISADVLSVAHHGSNTSSTAKFLNAVGGQYAVIGVGSPNSYNHPRDEVLARLENRGYIILRTDLHGNIVFICTDEGLEVHTQHDYY
jgi:beta-lactamase superfamily II metal-dependent hydrolase